MILCHGDAVCTAAPLWGEFSIRLPATKGQWCGALHVAFGVNLNMPLDKRSSCLPPCWWYETPRRSCDIIETIPTTYRGYPSCQKGPICHALGDISKWIFLNQDYGLLEQRWPSLLTHMCVILPQWVKQWLPNMMKWKHFPRYWPFVRGIHRSPVNSRAKASDAELWYFLWSASE